MGFAIRHPIKRIIDDQYDFLLSMLDRFPYLLEEWVKKQEEEVVEMAESVAEGDYEVYSSVYRNEIRRIESCYNEEQLFYQSMLIMVYAYYESSLLKLAKENQVTTPRASLIAAKFGVTLDQELMDISEFLFKTISPLRNQLCHNNSGTLFEKSSESERKCIDELVRKKVIAVDDGRITFIDKVFIKKTLDDEYKLLIKLADICGYKNRIV